MCSVRPPVPPNIYALKPLVRRRHGGGIGVGYVLFDGQTEQFPRFGLESQRIEVSRNQVGDYTRLSESFQAAVHRNDFVERFFFYV